MFKQFVKQMTLTCVVLAVGVLFMDQVRYSVKTEYIVSHTHKIIENRYDHEVEAKFLKQANVKSINVVYFLTLDGDKKALEVFTYKKSAINQAYRVINHIVVPFENEASVNKSFVVQDMGYKALVVFGMNSPYRIQVMRNRELAQTLETSSEMYYLHILEDIEHVYFYYVQ